MEKQLQKMVQPLLVWYEKVKRPLPWRENKNAYAIWISEIMLQQTRIEAVKSYYERFMKEIPTVYELAKIEEESLLKLWEGLGYYSRARNLKKAGIVIKEQYNGEMPKTYEELVKLPGIGPYTAGAIASIAYDERVPAIDGNVLRVVSRILASKDDVLLTETKKKIEKKLRQIMPKEAGNFNQALMELGETICLPNGIPNCKQCPLANICSAYKEGLTEEIPVREKKTTRKIEERTVFLLLFEDKVAIQKRQSKGLLANLYEFPNVLEKLKEPEIISQLKKWKLQVKENIEALGEYTHIFSHIEWRMIGYCIKVKKKNDEFLWIPKQELNDKYAIPTAFAKFRKQL